MKYDLKKYGYLRVAASAPELEVANVTFNSKKIIEQIEYAFKNDCYLIVFPELCLTSYTCGDLFFQKKLLDATKDGIAEIKEASAKYNSTVIIGAPLENYGKLYNCSIFISNGQILGVIPKTYLCNHNEYYESRWFASEFERTADFIEINHRRYPFGADLLFKDSNGSQAIVGIEICEDLWSVIPPSSSMALAGANVICNLSASNELLGKSEYRNSLVISQSARCIAGYIYSSAGVGESTTDTVFSGALLIAENGVLLSRNNRFHTVSETIFSEIDIDRLQSERRKNSSFRFATPAINYRYIDFNLFSKISTKFYRIYSQKPFVPEDKSKRDEVCNEILELQINGLIKRLKYIGLDKIVVGISGGLDSTLALLSSYLCFKRFKIPAKNIIAVTMPGEGTTSRTENNAIILAKELKTTLLRIPIYKIVDEHLKELGVVNKNSITFENSQARERTQILFDLANEYKALAIGTGDLSEIALGWSTYGGDQISMYNLNSGVPKTLVKFLVEWIAETQFKDKISKILKDICETPISPELQPLANKDTQIQLTEEIIGPYELHDFFLYYFVRYNFTPEKILFLAQISFAGKYSNSQIRRYLKIFYERFFKNQFKRSCSPDGIKIGSVGLSPRADWRMPSDANVLIWLSSL